MNLEDLTEQQIDFILQYQLAQVYNDQEFQQAQQVIGFQNQHQQHEFQNPKQKAKELLLPLEFFSPIRNKQSQSIFDTRFITIKEIGRGGFGAVIHVKDRDGGGEYAIKQVKTNDCPKVLHEIKILSQLQSQYIVRYYDAWIETIDCQPSQQLDTQTCNITAQKAQFSTLFSNNNQYYYQYEVVEEDYLETDYFNDTKIKQNTVDQITQEQTENLVCIQMELCKGDTLLKHIQQDSLTNKNKWDITIQLLLGLEFIHRTKIIHRDIKPENIFLSETLQAKYGDFGIAFTTNSKQQQNCGTIAYMPPESFRQNQLDFLNQCKRDIYSLGFTFLLLWQPQFQFQQYKDIKGQKQTLLNLIDNQEIKNIILMMIHENYEIRSSLGDIFKQRVIFQNIENIDSFVISYCQNLKTLQQSGDNVQKLINLLIEQTPIEQNQSHPSLQVINQSNFKTSIEIIEAWDSIIDYQDSQKIHFLDQYLQSQYMIQNDQTLQINIQGLPVIYYINQNFSKPLIFYDLLENVRYPVLVQKYETLNCMIEKIYQLICNNHEKQIYLCHLFIESMFDKTKLNDEINLLKKIQIKKMSTQLKQQFIWEGFKEFSFVFVVNSQVVAFGGIIGSFIQCYFLLQ